jgi:hypothetical protein
VPDLFTLTELASYIQRDVDTASATLAPSVAEGLVEDEIGRLDETTSNLTLPIDRATSTDELNVTGPITAVSAVEVGGVAATFEWERPYPRVYLRNWSATADRWQVAEVTLTHGWGVIPAIAKAVGLSVAARAYTNPNGFRQETIDDYSVTRAGGDDDIAGSGLTKTEREALSRLTPNAYSTAG